MRMPLRPGQAPPPEGSAAARAQRSSEARLQRRIQEFKSDALEKLQRAVDEFEEEEPGKYEVWERIILRPAINTLLAEADVEALGLEYRNKEGGKSDALHFNRQRRRKQDVNGNGSGNGIAQREEQELNFNVFNEVVEDDEDGAAVEQRYARAVDEAQSPR